MDKLISKRTQNVRVAKRIQHENRERITPAARQEVRRSAVSGRSRRRAIDTY